MTETVLDIVRSTPNLVWTDNAGYEPEGGDLNREAIWMSYAEEYNRGAYTFCAVMYTTPCDDMYTAEPTYWARPVPGYDGWGDHLGA